MNLNIMNKLNSFILILGFFGLSLQGCGSATTGGGDPGINLNFSTSGGSSSSVSALVTITEDYCEEATENEPTGSETQYCTGTPDNYNMGILAIYLLDCKNADSESIVCGSSSVSSITRTTLYDGTQVDMTISNSGGSFTGTIEEITEDVSVGGIQVVTSYIEQVFPTEGDEANKVMASLRGTTYRICQTPDDDSDNMETRCGHADAQRGDYLVDLDDDGTFGFITNVTETEFEESDTRPDSYDNFNDENFTRQDVCFNSFIEDDDFDCSNEYTTGTDGFYSIAGFFAPILPTSSVQSLSVNGSYAISIEFDITDTFAWTDGADGPVADGDTCVGAISSECEEDSEDDSDSGSPGVYNTFYDTAFLPLVPSVEVTIAESE